VGVAASPAAAPERSQARWLALALEGEPVGRTHEVVEGVAGGGFATRVASEIRIGRLGKVVEMATDFTLTEDAQGALQAVRGETRLSRQVTTSEVSFAAGAATVRESAGGPVHTRSVAIAAPLLGPEGVRRLIAARLRGAGDTVEYLAWSAALTAPQRVRCTAEDFEAVAVDGAPTRLLRVQVVADGEGAPRMAWFDASGRELRTRIALPFGAMVATQARVEPRMPGGELSVDVFTRTLIRSNVRLPGPRALDRMVVRVELDAVGRIPALDGAGERVTAQDARGAVIEIVRAEPPARGAAGSPIGPEYLAASAIIDPSEPAVRAIAAEVSDGAADAWDRAQRLTRWVTEHMTFDAGIAFAPAAELARDRHGTCAGYAVLLASLLRAADIPARLDLGLVYTGGIFGGHAWVEAWIGGRWVPLDAALPGDGPADAARIAFASDALDRGSGAMMAALGQVVGHATLRVLGYAPHGRAPVQVDDAAPYTIDGARYVNRGLGLAITAPAGYRFTDMDAVWPDRTVVALAGKGGTVAIAEAELPPGRDPALAEAEAVGLRTASACRRGAIAGRPACAAERDGVARLAFRDGPALYVLVARGPRPRALLDAVAGGVRLDTSPR
jgi:transglutaminase-like putative cysteine protease